MSKDLIHDVGHKSVCQWVRLKGKTREGKTQIKEHGTRWLITEIRGASPVMPENFRLLIRSEKNEWIYNRPRDYCHRDWATSFAIYTVKNDGRWQQYLK